MSFILTFIRSLSLNSMLKSTLISIIIFIVNYGILSLTPWKKYNNIKLLMKLPTGFFNLWTISWKGFFKSQPHMISAPLLVQYLIWFECLLISTLSFNLLIILVWGSRILIAYVLNYYLGIQNTLDIISWISNYFNIEADSIIFYLNHYILGPTLGVTIEFDKNILLNNRIELDKTLSQVHDILQNTLSNIPAKESSLDVSSSEPSISHIDEYHMWKDWRVYAGIGSIIIIGVLFWYYTGGSDGSTGESNSFVNPNSKYNLPSLTSLKPSTYLSGWNSANQELLNKTFNSSNTSLSSDITIKHPALIVPNSEIYKIIEYGKTGIFSQEIKELVFNKGMTYLNSEINSHANMINDMLNPTYAYDNANLIKQALNMDRILYKYDSVKFIKTFVLTGNYLEVPRIYDSFVLGAIKFYTYTSDPNLFSIPILNSDQANNVARYGSILVETLNDNKFSFVQYGVKEFLKIKGMSLNPNLFAGYGLYIGELCEKASMIES